MVGEDIITRTAGPGKPSASPPAGNPLIGTYASAGGRAKAQQRRLTLARVEAELPRMESPEAVGRRLELLTDWAAGGLLSGVVASACIRACEVWYRVNDLALDRERTRQLERRVRELEGELKRQAATGGARS